MVNEKEMTVEERLELAKKPGKDAMVMHKFYGGKIETVPKACVRSFDDFAIWYSPGVAEPCKDIAANPDMVYEHTCKWNTVAVVSDGTRVLGLGDIGPEAAMPVMEGKAMLFKYLGGSTSRTSPTPSASTSWTSSGGTARSPSGTTTSREPPPSRSPGPSTP